MSDTTSQSLPNGPLVQAAGIAFRLCVAATLALALLWLASNIRQVPSGSTAIVQRFGRVVTVQGAGLLLALPTPFDRVELVPGSDQQISLTIASPRTASLKPQSGGAGTYLTGDGGVILLDAGLAYRVTDPVAYLLAQVHVAPALDRIFRAAAVTVAAGRKLDDFMVVDQSRAASGRTAAGAALRQGLLDTINHRLHALDENGLGIEVTRLDLTAALPPSAKQTYDSVLTATQTADERLANARTDAAHQLQQASRDHDRMIDVARATAAERIATAHTHTATANALAASITPDTRANLLDQIYRSRIAAILRQAGQLTAVDPRGGPRVLLSGGKQ